MLSLRQGLEAGFEPPHAVPFRGLQRPALNYSEQGSTQHSQLNCLLPHCTAALTSKVINELFSSRKQNDIDVALHRQCCHA